ncbi:PREDICTED: probable membrane-associated kinase regulator 2 [Nicotiana attenuata]|uniref:Membrane-associated kinase regulator 5 n=1 Tax=Nicotiana attenuata TaxID=49451 RepID=A0A314LFB1_NICAT|nr:PREDICTED: probable membrane-associated kinase regulator 2 [Nicotiana attenuata]OIT39264.1 putative membrane-associated kinase regulator 5 [Nicotiana attenuata]
MKTFKLLKCWPNMATVCDTISHFDSVKNIVDGMDYVTNPNVKETDDDENSFFHLVFTGRDERPKVDSNSKPHSPITVLRSCTKIRVFFLGLKKLKPEKSSIQDSSTARAKRKKQTLSPRTQSNRIAVKRNVKDVPVISSMLSTDNSLRSKLQKEKEAEFERPDVPKTKLLSSRRKSSEEKQGNRVAVLGTVRKQLRKSRSAASVAGVSTSPMNRRDDSLLEQNDGIQAAILHCKRSYSTASKDCSMLLPRSTSEDVPRPSSYEEQSRWSI